MSKVAIRQILLFCIVGGAGFFVNAFMLRALQGSCGPYLAQAIGFSFAVVVTWVLNRRFTFDYRGGASIKEIGAYLVGNIAGWASINIIFFSLVEFWIIGKRYPVIALGCGAAVGAVINFIVLKFWAFSERRAGTDGRRKSSS